MSETPATLGRRDDHVEALRGSLSSTEHGLGTVPNAVKVVVREEMWRDRVIRQTGQRASFASFAAFVEAPPLEGLGATLDQLRGICRGDPEALDAIDRATQNAPSVHTGAIDNIQGTAAPSGTSSAAALRRLRKDRPDLHAEVIAKRMTAHAAMIEAGFRPKTITVPVTVDGLMRVFDRLGTLEKAQASCRVQEWPATWPEDVGAT